MTTQPLPHEEGYGIPDPGSEPAVGGESDDMGSDNDILEGALAACV